MFDNEELQSTNILSSFDKISKLYASGDGEFSIRELYNYLSDISHPNTLGFSRYFEEGKQLGLGGNIRRMKKRATGHYSQEIVENILSALSWGCVAVHNAFVLIHNDIGPLETRLRSLN